MSFLFFFKDDREKQLLDEKDIDRFLIKECSTCTDTLSTYYAWRREINREQFDKVSNANILNKYNVVEMNMNEITVHQEIIKNCISNGEDPCEFLKQFIRLKS